MKTGAWLYLFASTLLVAASGTLIYAFLEHQKPLLLGAFGVVLFSVFLLLIYRLVSSSARCPLCTVPVLLSKRCQRNRKAQRLFGSYRFKVAKDIALRGSFRCPYCGEETLCQVKDRYGAS
jgi:predicted RNA-binding Zn-ribbon protein involved in translation (DUF1610 family)